MKGSTLCMESNVHCMVVRAMFVAKHNSLSARTEGWAASPATDVAVAGAKVYNLELIHNIRFRIAEKLKVQLVQLPEFLDRSFGDEAEVSIKGLGAIGWMTVSFGWVGDLILKTQ